MGFDLQITRFVLDAYERGVDFSTVATLGRQNLNIDRRIYAQEAARFKLDASPEAIERVFSTKPYVDGMFAELGVPNVFSVDASSYEHASYVTDMNLPIPSELYNRFSVLIDGGTLEHVFNFPQAAENCAKMLKVGGHFISINGSNNFTGHGFYQFSPELFFRVFSPENGFEIETMILSECNDDAIWYEVKDPAKVRRRVQLINNARTYLMMRARKVADVPLFVQVPQQSDYFEDAWHDTKRVEAQAYLKRPLKQRIMDNYFPRPLRLVSRRLHQALRNHFGSADLTVARRF
jgi:SAM-dependent methyltransferase